MGIIDKLEEIFRHFPGIGPRQAKRFVYYLLTQSSENLNDLTKLISELKQSVSVCKKCQRFFPIGYNKQKSDSAELEVENELSQNTICAICSDENRDKSVLMLVSRDIDFQSVEKSRAYHGVYFILGGSIPLLEEMPALKIRQKELIERIKELSPDLHEIIVATNLNPEGEHTALYLSKLLKTIATESSPTLSFKITTLGRGLSTGTELEYSDSETLKSALENRR